MANFDNILYRGWEKSMFTEEQRSILISNGRTRILKHDAKPCVYLFGETKSFLISEILPSYPTEVYALFYDENYVPKLGMIRLDVISDYHKNKEFLFNDNAYEGDYPIQVYFRVAQELGTIIPDDSQFKELFKKHNY